MYYIWNESLETLEERQPELPVTEYIEGAEAESDAASGIVNDFDR